MTFEIRQHFVTLRDGDDYTVAIFRGHLGGPSMPATHAPGLKACYIDDRPVTPEDFIRTIRESLKLEPRA